MPEAGLQINFKCGINVVPPQIRNKKMPFMTKFKALVYLKVLDKFAPLGCIIIYMKL